MLVCAKIGMPVSPDNFVSLCQVIKFPGLLLDSARLCTYQDSGRQSTGNCRQAAISFKSSQIQGQVYTVFNWETKFHLQRSPSRPYISPSLV